MKKIDPLERDINRIRRQIQRETKDMTPVQFAEHFRRSTEAVMEKYGFTFHLVEDARGTPRIPRRTAFA